MCMLSSCQDALLLLPGHVAVQGVAEAECRRAAAAAEDAYKMEFNLNTPAEPEALLLEHLVSGLQLSNACRTAVIQKCCAFA